MSYPVLIAPSLLAADPLHLARAVTHAEQSGADLFHLDVMDGHYVPNLTFGPDIARALKQHTTCPIDVHLMVDTPSIVIPWFIHAGVDMISFHIEAESDCQTQIQRIQQHGIKAGIVLNPETPASAVPQPLVDMLDFVLIMSVKPGFGGQAFMPDVLPKIDILRAMRPNLTIEVDGGITVDTAPYLHEKGVNILVAGSCVFNTPNTCLNSTQNGPYTDIIRQLRGL